jgi:tetratricopeptide (TPR) repeat protein
MPGTEDTTGSHIHSVFSGYADGVVQARDIAGGVHFHGPARTSAVTPAQLPTDVRGFVNRLHDLAQLDQLLSEHALHQGSASICVITGTAGVGKTSLAVRWAHRARDQFPDGQLYVNLHGYDPDEPVPADRALERFLIALGILGTAIPVELEDRAALFRSLLADKRMLIVLDNAATVAQVRPLLPGSGGCLLLVTSRSRLSGLLTRDGARRITLEVFDEREAVELVHVTVAGYRSGDEEQEITELATLCARLPLALRIAAERAAARPRMPMQELIRDLRDESRLWETLSTQDEEADAVRTVFAWSYYALAQDTARIFRLLGMHPGLDFSINAAAALAQVPRDRARQLLDSLSGAHLIQQVSADRFIFHDLLRVYAAGQAHSEESPQEQRAAIRRVLLWYLHSAAAAAKLTTNWYRPLDLEPDQSIEHETFTTADQAIAWVDAEAANLLAATQLADHSGMDRIAWQLPEILAQTYFYRSGSAGSRLRLFGIALSAARRSADQFGEATCLHNLGAAYYLLQRLPDSVSHFRAALAIREQIEDNWGQADSLNSLGLTLWRARRYQEAARSLESALALYRGLGSDLHEAVAAGNLGMVLLDMKQAQEAAPILASSVVKLRTLGAQLALVDPLQVLARAHATLGNLDAALSAATEANSLARRAKASFHEGTALLTLGEVQLARGDSHAALTSFQRSAAIHRELADLSREGTTLNGVGRALQQLGRLDEAIACQRQALTIHSSLGDAYQTAVSLDQLASALQANGDRETARAHWHEAASLLGNSTDPKAIELHTRAAELGSG